MNMIIRHLEFDKIKNLEPKETPMSNASKISLSQVQYDKVVMGNVS
jgi:hypothetical protein